MILAWQLAWRYLRGKGSANAVPVLSKISMSAIAVASGAMIILFSVFNGFEDIIKDLYKAFYPEIKITPVKGKIFSLNDQQFDQLKAINGITAITKVIEDNVLLSSDEEQKVATLRGIDKNYIKVNDIKPYIIKGIDTVNDSNVPTAIVGNQIANQLGLEVNNVFSRIHLFYPNTASENLILTPESAFQQLQLKPNGIFMIQDEFDSKYILASLPLVQQLFLQPGKYSSLELSLNKAADPEIIRANISKLLGKDFLVATRYEQNRTFYMVMKTEKWVVYAILVLVLFIASFNMIGALTMLVLEKQKDIAILKAMGAQSKTIQAIFILEGTLWALVGSSIGLLLGAGICLGQKYFHWIKLQGAFIIDAYPVAMHWTDFILVIFTVIIVGLLTSWYPAVLSVRAEDPSLKSA